MLCITGAIVVASLCHASAARAASVIVGTVVGAENNKPVSNVIVTATSPGFEGERMAAADARGQYRIPDLPPGSYTLRFDRKSFESYSRSELRLRLDRTLRVNVVLAPESLIDRGGAGRSPAPLPCPERS